MTTEEPLLDRSYINRTDLYLHLKVYICRPCLDSGQYERPMTMASLFDGIGGFPLVFSRAGCKPVWASEIEEFPIAVTKRRFPE